ncbi:MULTISPECIES: hypothetical protein [unclassified Streptomyces]|uniref:hypothetical protein n=1 Tax=unclassified Streptomyces TaxID=2593676 RepID=UPI0029B12389|nr:MULTISPECIES: hypothetical protein [unclassified Streptomyces]MDX3771672.1 hypothetical protein [Streptomyces sp. AK08-01B]MDX3820835.1 hypothetical protein [Streptomyces sp. AK08-01A]
MISETVPEFGPRIATQARAHAEAVRPFLGQRRLREDRRGEAVDLIADIASNTSLSWCNRMQSLLGLFYTAADARFPQHGGIGIAAALQPVRYAVSGWELQAQGDDERWRNWQAVAVRDGELASVLADLHRGLIHLADNWAPPRPALPPAEHPPAYARLKEHVVAQTVAERLAVLVDEGVKHYEAARVGNGSGSVDEFPIDSQLPRWELQGGLSRLFADSLRAFLTTEVEGRYRSATGGFEHVERLFWQPVSADAEYGEIAVGILPRIYPAYLAIAVNYLAEVLELMPKYAEDSGQGKRRDPVVYNTYLPNAQGVIVGEQQNFTQNNTGGIDPRAFVQLAGYVGQVSSALGLGEPDRVELERVTQELHEEATSDAPQEGRLRQLAGQIKDRLLEAGATMAATVGIQMAEQAIGTLTQ